MKNPCDIIVGKYSLADILERHKHWINEDIEGWENMRANLSGADLCYADLCGADLCYADLSHANLYSASICYANLRCADLSYASLSYANLRYANFRCVDLHYADLSHANLYNVDFSGANLYYTSGANRYHTDCGIGYRKGKILTDNIVGYKKCKNNVMVTLEIPRGAVVFSINGNKCRTNKAKVIAIDGADRAISDRKHFTYYIGDEITVYNFNCEYNVECAEGIHFFMTKEEAESYDLATFVGPIPIRI